MGMIGHVDIWTWTCGHDRTWTWTHRHMDMDMWTYGHDRTWTYGHGHVDIVRDGHVDVDIIGPRELTEIMNWVESPIIDKWTMGTNKK